MRFNSHVSCYSDSSKWAEPLFEPGFFSIIVVVQGEVKLQQGSQIKSVKKGCLLINTPTNYHIVHTKSAQAQIIGIRFGVQYLNDLKNFYPFYQEFTPFDHQFLPIWSLDNRQYNIVEYQITKLAQRQYTQEHHLFKVDLFHLAFIEFLLELLDIGYSQDQQALVHYSRSEYLCLEFLRLAKQHYLTYNNLDFYASELSITVKYLSALLKKYTGKTAKSLLLELKINQAKYLLSNTVLDISSIAYELNYDSPSSFTKIFKQVVGMSPTEFRNNLE